MFANSGLFCWICDDEKLTGKIIKDSLTNSVYRLSILICAISLLSMIILRALGMTTGYIYTAYAGRLAPLAFCSVGCADHCGSPDENACT